jgi:hypothetical protein
VQSCPQGKGWLLWRIQNIESDCFFVHFFVYYTILCVLFHSVDVFLIILQCKKLRKTLEWVGVSKLLTGTIYVYITYFIDFPPFCQKTTIQIFLGPFKVPLSNKLVFASLWDASNLPHSIITSMYSASLQLYVKGAVHRKTFIQLNCFTIQTWQSNCRICLEQADLNIKLYDKKVILCGSKTLQTHCSEQNIIELFTKPFSPYL